jgi:hypothetical protein
MPKRIALLLFFALPVLSQTNGDREITGTLQRLFDAMAKRDVAGVRAVFIANASVIAIRSGKLSASNSEEFANRLATSADAWIERIWSPVVKVQGNIAMLWAPYDFHRGGKLDHCGIDSVSLARSEGGWKIASLTFTSETEGCAASPLGPLH